MREHSYYVYIMASRSRTLYIGFTSALESRVLQHKEGGVFNGFSKQYARHRLLYFETYAEVQAAIAREKQFRRWSRSKKLNLILRSNPGWYDLCEDWAMPSEL